MMVSSCSNWRRRALALLLLGVSITNVVVVAATEEILDEQQHQQNHRQLPIAKDTLYQTPSSGGEGGGGKAGKPKYHHGGHTGPKPKPSSPNNNGGGGGKAGKASTEQVAVNNDAWWSSPHVTQSPVFGPDGGTSDVAMTDENQEEEETAEELEIEAEEAEMTTIIEGGGGGAIIETLPPQEEEHYAQEEEVEVGTVSIHHGQNGGHTGPKAPNGGKAGKATVAVPIKLDTWAGTGWSSQDTAEEEEVHVPQGPVFGPTESESWGGGATYHQAAAKSGKAYHSTTATSTTPIKGETKAGKAVSTPHDAIYNDDDDAWQAAAASVDLEEEGVSESLKPKSHKELSPYFIKETSWQAAHHKEETSLFGKSSKNKSNGGGKAGKSTAHVIHHGPHPKPYPSGSGKAHKQPDDSPHPNDGSSDDKPITPHPNDVEEDPDSPYWIYVNFDGHEDCYFSETNMTILDGSVVFMTRDECCDAYPSGCTAGDEDDGEDGDMQQPPTTPSGPGLSPTEDMEDMLTMEPTPAVVPSPTPDTSGGGDEGSDGASIVDIASGDENFSTLVSAIQAAGLVDALNGPGPFTVLAPNNDAFATLPDGTLDMLLLPENQELLVSILTYHVLPGRGVLSEELISGPITMLNGEVANVIVNDDGSVMINDANVITSDIVASNGVIHVIDKVLLPPGDFDEGDGGEGGEGDEGTDDMGEGGEGGEGGGDAKYYPYQNDETNERSCEYGSDYPPDYPTFDSMDDCCAFFPPGQISNCPKGEGEDDPMRAPPNENDWPSYSPTYDPDRDFKEPLLSAQGEEVVALEPFGLKVNVNSGFDEGTVTSVTQAHLTHSLRTKGYDLTRMSMVVLEEDGVGDQRRNLAQQYEVIFGGVLYFNKGTTVPTVEQMEEVVTESFEHERLEYYIDLLEEEGMDVDNVSLDKSLADGYHPDGTYSAGFNWSGFAIGMSSAIGGLALLLFGGRFAYNKHRDRVWNIDSLNFDDLEKGSDDYKDYGIRLQYTNDEIETVAETASKDQLSVPSLVQAAGGIFKSMTTPGGHSSSSKSSTSSGISPLESPQIDNSKSPEASSTTRYISVFTVKKDCGGKPLNQVDLRALAIAYLSRMLKKFPNTHLLPYDKTSNLPAITNIRNIPDDIEDLQQYVGNARVDDKTGKVLFNLRVESDEPVSKMKSNSSRFKAKKHTSAPLDSSATKPKPKSEDSLEEEDENAPLSPKSPKSPKSPGILEDVDL